ncbi:MAG TPA: cupin domain-containing protein [Chloroflexota bacterium]|nr:cupin domain-containing protein [Chloroflexota bacterium]
MVTFYDEWLAAGAQAEEAFRCSPMIAHDRQIPWVRTRQDARVKLMVDNSLGFPTMGGSVLKGEIPVGWHTGKHTHGEEGIYILKGQGFSVINGQRFDWKEGSALHIPYRAEHQHFNTGDEPAVYLSGMAFPLERFVHLARLEQLEDCGPTDPAVLAAIPPERSQYLEGGARAVIHLEQAGADDSFHPQAHLASAQNQHALALYLVVPKNGFQATSVAVTSIFEEPPYHHSGRHKHLEAVIYVLEGEGYSEVQGRDERWEAGDILHVPPAMFEHEHYNDSPKAYRQVRIQFGIRYWFTDIWPEGYTAQRCYDEYGQPIIAGMIERVRER